ncbi:cupin domain-containing protein [Pseudoalteromonas sp. ASV78]|uniref:cupin domain-containing protein n=1 Tax=Pseudoalteromonas sp. ASV78 TaxID=3397851 RepID=UPI0039FBF09C
MTQINPVSIQETFKEIKCLEGRTPETTNEEAKDSFAKLSDYRDGGIFITHYSGNSEWERHSNGDELVQVIEGETTLILLSDNNETPHILRESELLVVPKNMWHRFETPKAVKVMTVTPQPTEHSVERPENA